MEQALSVTDGIGTFGLAVLIAFAVYRGWLVLGREYDKESARVLVLEEKISQLAEAQRATNEANARLAEMVPDLVTRLEARWDRAQDGAHGTHDDGG